MNCEADIFEVEKQNNVKKCHKKVRMDQILVSKRPIPLMFGDTEMISFLDLATTDPMRRGAFYNKSDNLLRRDRKRERK